MASAVACCGCGRVLLKNGEVGPNVFTDGILDLSKCQELLAGQREQIGIFNSKTEADQFAEKHGWSTHDQFGPNHRCPSCLKTYLRRMDQIEARGAYIPVEMEPSCEK